MISVTKLKGLQQQLTDEIKDTHNQSAKYYDKKHVTRLMFSERDMVYINCKNIKTKWPSDKLDYVWLGLFPIIDVLGKVIYKVKLLTHIRIYPVFHMLWLELAKGKQKHLIALQLSGDNKDVK